MSVTEQDTRAEHLAEPIPTHVVKVRRLADGNQSAVCTCGEFTMRRAHPRAVDLYASGHAHANRGRVEMPTTPEAKSW